MERFAWLNTQKRWIQPWKGCEKIKWIFEGFASFDIDERGGTLLFATTMALPHPARLAIRVGLVMKQQQEKEEDCSGMEKLILSFDNSNPFVLEISQVESISSSSEDIACCSCQLKAVSKKEICEPIQACGKSFSDCGKVPGHITLKLQHVALNLLAGLQFSETCQSTISLPQLMEVLNKLFLEQQHLCLIDKNVIQVEENYMQHVEFPTKASEAINQSCMLLHEYLNGIDCLNDCVMKAIETCSADPSWMGRMLDIMAHHAGNQSLELYKLETLKQVLYQQLEELMEREKHEIEKTWGANTQHFKQQRLKDSSTSALESINQERKCVEAALLQAHHAGNQSLELYKLETLKQVLYQQLEELMEREKHEIEKTWGANTQHFKQQRLKDSSTSALESINQERKCVEAALLQVEVLCTGVGL